jgi:putative ABC transport system permease protein
MMSIALRNARTGKARTAFSVAGVAVASLLLAFVLALYRGWNEGLVTYIESSRAEVWVTQKGNDSFFAPSVISTPLLVQVQQEPGVTHLSSVLGRRLKMQHGNASFDAYVLGFDPGGAGGPVHIKSGSGTPAIGEIVVDDVLARAHNLKIGDEVKAGLRTLKIVGISSGGNLVIAQLSFVSKEEARALAGFDGFVNFALLSVEPGQEDRIVSDVNTSMPGLSAYTAKDFADNSRAVLQSSLLPILRVILILAVVVGTVVVGLTVYTSVLEKEREFGVMKALGAPRQSLARVVVEETFACCLAGFVLGEGASLLSSLFAERAVPQFVTQVQSGDIATVFATTLFMGVVAAFIPIQRLMRVDALTVFKA